MFAVSELVSLGGRRPQRVGSSKGNDNLGIPQYGVFNVVMQSLTMTRDADGVPGI